MKTTIKSILGTALLVMSSVLFADSPKMEHPATPEQGGTEKSVVTPAESQQEKAEEKM